VRTQNTPELCSASFPPVVCRIVTGNADSCFYLDESTGILSAKCDLGRLPMVRRTLNLTATDGQHFADVMPLEINLIGEGASKKRIKNMLLKLAVTGLHRQCYSFHRTLIDFFNGEENIL
jgi:hypothetical protein